MDERELTLNGVREVGTETFAAAFAVPDELVAYPGQFVRLSMPVDGESASSFYTISSADSGGTIEIVFDADPDSTFGRALADADPGTTVSVAGPTGDTYYDGGAPVVVLAGGPGIGAALGIGERALADDQDVAVVYEGTPVDEARLDDLSAAGAHVAVVEEGVEDLSEAVAGALETVDGGVLIYGYDEFVERASAAVSAADGNRADPRVSNYG